MRLRPRTVILTTFVAALVVFAVVQDRVTAAGARQYITLQRQTLAGGAAPVTIDEVMVPAVQRSVRQGLTWASLVVVGGVAISRFFVPGSGFRVRTDRP